ncbi:MAG: recombinase family protein [Pseudonocardiaceae bacterium]
MSRQAQSSKNALIFLMAPRWERRRKGDVPVESPVLFHQREAIKRKAEELDADIVKEFVISKQSDLLTNPLFREMLHVITGQGIDYVLIYPDRLHRDRERSAVITGAINLAGAQVVSASHMTGIAGEAEFILYMVNDFDRFARRDAQLRTKWKCAKRSADAA